jgi:hypothetical protein
MTRADRRGADTSENRVYVFESLARAFIEASAGELASASAARRRRALRALGDLAYVSCVIADSGALPPAAVRRQVLAGLAADAAASRSSQEDD